MNADGPPLGDQGRPPAGAGEPGEPLRRRRRAGGGSYRPVTYLDSAQFYTQVSVVLGFSGVTLDP